MASAKVAKVKKQTNPVGKKGSENTEEGKKLTDYDILSTIGKLKTDSYQLSFILIPTTSLFVHLKINSFSQFHPFQYFCFFHWPAV